VGSRKSGLYLKNEEEYSLYLIQRIASQKDLYIDNRTDPISEEQFQQFMQNMTWYFNAVSLLRKRDFDTKMLLNVIHHGVRDKFFLEKRSNFEALSRDLTKAGYQPKEIEYDPERNIYEMDIYDPEGKQFLLRVGREILATSDYKQMLKSYEKIAEFNRPPFAVMSKQEDARIRNEFATIDELYAFLMAEAKKGITIQRYKGLGEMNAEQLWETTMNPEKRMMLQVNIEDAEKADEIFTLLMGEEVEPRRNFIQKHALEVTSLDY
jgi:DNA gyrase subunit B